MKLFFGKHCTRDQRGRLDDLFISLLKKSRKSFPSKTGLKSNEGAIVLHQQINKTLE